MSDNKPISPEQLAELYKLIAPPKSKSGGYAEYTDETEEMVRIVGDDGSITHMPTEVYFATLPLYNPHYRG